MKYSKELPITETTDVLVVGGDPAGIAAAVSSARSGLKTILLEKEIWFFRRNGDSGHG